MYAALSTIRLGFETSLDELVDLAVAHDYAGVEPSGAAFFGASRGEQLAFVARLRDEGLAWALSALPWGLGATTTDARFDELADLIAERAPVLADAGARGFATWIAPAGDAAPYADVLALHLRRIDRLTPILADHGLRLALEYVGPRASRGGHRHPFIHDLRGVRSLIASAADPERLGLLLDSFHWYCSGEGTDALRDLSARDVLAVDLNDALPHRDVRAQLDGERALPGATGVIDLPGFVSAIAGTGYTGPVVAEPLEWGVSGASPAERVAGARRGLAALLDGGAGSGK
jgi:sugar phosphate isomerase/epimerase